MKEFSFSSKKNRNLPIPISYTSVNNKMQWCVLDPTFMNKNMRKHFYHFPHALEAILPCYSKLIEKNAITAKLLDEAIGETLYERNCGFMIHTNLAKNESSLSPYIKQVFDKIDIQFIIMYYKKLKGKRKPFSRLPPKKRKPEVPFEEQGVINKVPPPTDVIYDDAILYRRGKRSKRRSTMYSEKT